MIANAIEVDIKRMLKQDFRRAKPISNRKSNEIDVSLNSLLVLVADKDLLTTHSMFRFN